MARVAEDGPIDDGGARRLLRWAIGVSAALLVFRFALARGLGFGDAEALYACYALHPQPAYLDHPGLVGTAARLLGDGGAPSPEVAHAFAAVIATLVPWLGGAAALATGGTRAGALRSVLGLALVPELSIGLFALTPDLLLAPLWLGALGLGSMALRSDPKSFRALVATVATGALIGGAFLAKLSGALLGIAFLAVLFSREVRARLRTAAPWCAMAIFAVLAAPVIAWEAHNGWPMLAHRLVSTQAGAGFSLRNLGALLGGQLLYVTPFFLVATALLLRDLHRRRNEDAVARLLWLATVAPGAALVALCLWSRVAEPHWLAPAYLPLALHLARSAVVGRRIAIASLATGAVAAVLAWAVVKTPIYPKLAGSSYRPRYDLTNDLWAWGPGQRLLQRAVEDTMRESQRLPVVVGPHYIVCAQAHAALGGRVPVGCNSPIRDDFDVWWPRARWFDAPVVLYVSDSRFELDPASELPGRIVGSISKVDVRRGSTVVRTISVTRLERVRGFAR